MPTLRIGAKLPNSGRSPSNAGSRSSRARSRTPGFDSLWVSDHVVLPRAIESHYPFAADGRATWPSDTPVSRRADRARARRRRHRARRRSAPRCSCCRSVSRSSSAKQLASIDVASRGRLQLGVGAGWLREEFDALDVPFDDARLPLRGVGGAAPLLLDRGAGGARRRHYTLPADVLCLPTPAHGVPILVGGHSPAGPAARRRDRRRLARAAGARRARHRRDRAARRTAADAARAAGRDPDGCGSCCGSSSRPDGAPSSPRGWAELAAAGVDEVIVDVDWAAGDPAAELERSEAGLA